MLKYVAKRTSHARALGTTNITIARGVVNNGDGTYTFTYYVSARTE